MNTLPQPVRPWKELVLPEAVTSLKSMISYEEKQYLCWYASQCYEGWGAIVDAGCWLGAASAALAEGLRRRQSKAKIHSLDHFLWSPGYMDEVAGNCLSAGADFLPLFLQQTSDYSEWLAPRRQDLTECPWEGGPIEFLFVDAGDDWEAITAILSQFEPFLEPLRSRIVLHNFRYQGPPWLPLIFDSRPDIWEEIESVEYGHAVTFRTLQRLDGPARLHWGPSGPSFPLASAERLFRNRIANGEPLQSHWFLRMLYRKYLLDGPIERAREVRTELLANGMAPDVELERIEDICHLLLPRGWDCYKNSDFHAAAAHAQRCLTLAEQSVPALWLLSISLFRAGKPEAAAEAIERVLTLDPLHANARLCRAELSIAQRSYADARRSVLEVLDNGPLDEGTIAYGISILSQACSAEGGFLDCLLKLRHALPASPTLLSALTHEQWRAGMSSDARATAKAALALSLPEELAHQVREELAAIADGQSSAAATVAGSLPQVRIPSRSRALEHLTIGDLTAELIFRCSQGCFEKTEEAVRFGQHIEYAIKAALNTHLNRFSIQRYRDLFESMYAVVDPPMPLARATVLDLGCGSTNPFGWAFLLLLLGARRAYAVDLDPVEDWGRALQALPELAGIMLTSPGQIVERFPVNRTQILDQLADFDLELMRAGDRGGLNPQRVDYRRESVHALSLPDAEVDYVFSNAFFEHIPRVDKAVAELARVTRRGGMGVHVIDCSDHRRYHAPETHHLQFLTEMHTEPLPRGTNRLRPHEFTALFKQAGFDILQVGECGRVDIEPDFHTQLVEPFRSMTDDLLGVTIVRLVVRKC